MSSREPGDIKPKCQDFQAPGVCSLAEILLRALPIYTSFLQRRNSAFVPLSLYKLATAKPWFSKDVSLLAMVVPTRFLYRKGISSPVALSPCQPSVKHTWKFDCKPLSGSRSR
jgi:hypothetical protein